MNPKKIEYEIYLVRIARNANLPAVDRLTEIEVRLMSVSGVNGVERVVDFHLPENVMLNWS